MHCPNPICQQALGSCLLAVTDGHLITANGIAQIEFAREVFKTIGLYSDAAIEKWFQLFKNGVWSE